MSDHRFDNSPGNPTPVSPVAQVEPPPIVLSVTAYCPKCGRQTGTPSSANQHAWFCHWCKMEFEDVDDGTTGYGDPARTAEWRDEKRNRRRR